MTADARVTPRNGTWDVEQGAFFRTQRRLFEGRVLVRTPREVCEEINAIEASAQTC